MMSCWKKVVTSLLRAALAEPRVSDYQMEKWRCSTSKSHDFTVLMNTSIHDISSQTYHGGGIDAAAPSHRDANLHPRPQ
jgi:hypothetical protein